MFPIMKYISCFKLNNRFFDENGLDGSGTHWLQYVALFVSAIAVWSTWAYFFDEEFHGFVLRLLRLLDCKGFNSMSKYCFNYLRK